MDKEILTIEGVANLLGVSRYSIYRLLKRKELPGVKIGKSFRFHKQTIIDWLATGGNANYVEQIFKNIKVKKN